MALADRLQRLGRAWRHMTTAIHSEDEDDVLYGLVEIVIDRLSADVVLIRDGETPWESASSIAEVVKNIGAMIAERLPDGAEPMTLSDLQQLERALLDKLTLLAGAGSTE